MKHLYFLMAALFVFTMASAQPLSQIPKPVVDERVELLSIVFRLAGNTEYNTDDNTAYVKAIHQHFDRYANHPLIAFAKELHDSSGISYDAVMSMAIHLRPGPSLSPIVPFNTGDPNNRWNAKDADKFVKLLQQFYKDADCAKFFSAQAGRYALAKLRFELLFNKLDVAWYRNFYGSNSNEEFNVLIGLGNGGGNYGPHIDIPGKGSKVYAIIGSSTFDGAGDPTYDAAGYLPVLIHEFNHSFINPLNDLLEKQLSESGQIIFEQESAKMKRMAYAGWKTMYNEALVRAAVVMYLKNHNADTTVADHEMKAQQASGFIWMPQLVNLLKQYEQQRNTYKTLQAFMPRVVEFYKEAALNIPRYEAEYLQNCAKVISVTPAVSDRKDVSPATQTIMVNFDKALDGIRYFVGPGKKGRDHYPKNPAFSFTNGNKSLVMQMKLEPNTEYQIVITGSRMRTNDGYSVQNYLIEFRTGAK